jgi:hypothetical protein
LRLTERTCQVSGAACDSIRMTTAPRLDAAFDRIDDFVAVQGPTISPEAVNLLQEAVGVDEGARRIIRERIAALGNASAASVLLGVLVGLLAAEAAT